MHLIIQVCPLVPSAGEKPVNVSSSDCCKTNNIIKENKEELFFFILVFKFMVGCFGFFF